MSPFYLRHSSLLISPLLIPFRSHHLSVLTWTFSLCLEHAQLSGCGFFWPPSTTNFPKHIHTLTALPILFPSSIFFFFCNKTLLVTKCVIYLFQRFIVYFISEGVAERPVKRLLNWSSQETLVALPRVTLVKDRGSSLHM